MSAREEGGESGCYQLGVGVVVSWDGGGGEWPCQPGGWGFSALEFSGSTLSSRLLALPPPHRLEEHGPYWQYAPSSLVQVVAVLDHCRLWLCCTIAGRHG